jgi:hypothetical protein
MELKARWSDEKATYIAVSEWGCASHELPAMAIRLAQAHVPAQAEESQLLLYESFNGAVAPVGWKDGPVWPDGKKRKRPDSKNRARARAKSALLDVLKAPRLVGLTSTHRGFQQKAPL